MAVRIGSNASAIVLGITVTLKRVTITKEVMAILFGFGAQTRRLGRQTLSGRRQVVKWSGVGPLAQSVLLVFLLRRAAPAARPFLFSRPDFGEEKSSGSFFLGVKGGRTQISNCS